MLYEPTGYDSKVWPDSYWRGARPSDVTCPALEGDKRADVAIIGAGYAGLNAGLELVERHGLDLVVLDAGQPGWGASGRNGGFCCLGGARLSPGMIRQRFGQAAVQDWADYERVSIDRVRDNLARYDIDAEAVEPGELLLADTPRRWAAMRAEPPEDGVRLLDRAALRDEGLDSAVYHGAKLSPEGFGLQPYAYATGLARAGLATGLRIFGDSRAQRLAPEGAGWRISTARGHVLANQVLVATNGYSDEVLVPWLRRRILPALSNVMVTRPLRGAELQAQGWTRQLMSYDDRVLLHYFRLLPDNRFLFGARGGLSFSAASVRSFAARARAEFDTIFPHFAQAETEYTWNGLVCLTASLAPYIGPVPGTQGLWLALGWHGNGVAAASEGGRRVAQAMCGVRDAPPQITRRPPPRFLLPRKWALAAGMALGGLHDGPLRAA